MSLVVDMSKKIHEQITPETWCSKGGGCLDSGALCIWLWCSERYRGSWQATLEKLAERLGHTGKDMLHTLHIYSWNDAPERTFDDVLSVLKELDL